MDIKDIVKQLEAIEKEIEAEYLIKRAKRDSTINNLWNAENEMLSKLSKSIDEIDSCIMNLEEYEETQNNK